MKKFKNKILYFINYLSAKIVFFNYPLFYFFRILKKYPKIFIIEPTNMCNGTCPLCPIGLKQTTRVAGNIDFDKYRKLIDEISRFGKTVIFNFAGEPTMHPRIGSLIAYAKAKGLEVIIGTNGSINKAAEIIAAAPDEILFALDGATAETYHKYRNFPGVTFAQVLHNLRDLAEEKKKQKNSFTKIILQFVVMKANEHEIEDILKLAKNFALDGVDYKPVSLMAAESLDKNSAIAEFLPNHAIKQYQKTKTNVKVLQAGYCSFAFSTAVILHNGELSSCCYDFDGQQTFGNVFANGFAYAWMSDKAREYRKFIFWKKLRLCQNCGNTYKTVKRVLIK